jgi:hypothetical protein
LSTAGYRQIAEAFAEAYTAGTASGRLSDGYGDAFGLGVGLGEGVGDADGVGLGGRGQRVHRDGERGRERPRHLRSAPR